MKKWKKIVLGIILIILVIILIWLFWFSVDFVRVKQNKAPIFCIKSPAGVYLDGGTQEYYGLGYKIIVYKKMSGYHGVHLGSYSMKYDSSL